MKFHNYDHLDRYKDSQFFENIIWSDECKIELFGHNDVKNVWRPDGKAYDAKYVVPSVKHGGWHVDSCGVT